MPRKPADSAINPSSNVTPTNADTLTDVLINADTDEPRTRMVHPQKFQANVSQFPPMSMPGIRRNIIVTSA